MSTTGGAAPQTNGVPSSSAASTSQTLTNNTQTQQPPSQSQPGQSQPSATTPSQTQPPNPQQPQPQQNPPPQPQQQQPTTNPHPTPSSSTAPRPRDARTIELLLTAQGVTAFEQRVPLLLLDFAYRHTSAVLSDALHLAADPYTSHAGARPSAAKDWIMELAREKNKIGLPRVMPSEWGVRLPGERFVLSGVPWGLRDVWAGQEGAEETSGEEDDDEEMLDGPGDGRDAMDVETEDVGGEGVEGGTMGDVFGDEGLEEDEEMAEA
ncbi:hypothetical protein F5144DRAFT_523032 [Chaetomium tenue]|uniref:Uncharacterized protein n=1 Tax=Chaetomium tenue TaxID=1854479 RepID=A0ACB7PP68_9PEZI|nr:hypothetical protein F5144DRAFT_523032 [Chaetomium globosum]